MIYRKVDDCWILLDEKVILCEPFVANDEIRREFGELEPL